MKEMFDNLPHTGKVGCIILTDFKVFENPVYLSNTNVVFANSTMSGMGITEKEVASILEYGFGTLDNVVRKVNEADRIGFTEDEDGFPEGKQVLKQHLVRERNPEVIKLAKEHFLQRHGKLFCEVCGFDFGEHYGVIGEGYIEGHHTKPISEMGENE
jgi:predicted HNH restriction endonuclease